MKKEPQHEITESHIYLTKRKTTCKALYMNSSNDLFSRELQDVGVGIRWGVPFTVDLL